MLSSQGQSVYGAVDQVVICMNNLKNSLDAAKAAAIAAGASNTLSKINELLAVLAANSEPIPQINFTYSEISDQPA